MYAARITLTGVNGDEVVLSDRDGKFGAEGMELDLSPKGGFSTAFSARTVSGAFTPGGRIVGEEIPIRQLTWAINLYDIGGGIEATIDRFRNLWPTVGVRQRQSSSVTYTYVTELSGARWLKLRLGKEIELSPERDWNLDGFARAVVSPIAPQPMFESDPDTRSWENPSAGTNTGWIPCWNPTDQDMFLEWVLDPATQWQFPDFSFGNEWYYQRDTDVDDDRMIITPTLTQKLSVMADPVMDTYISADKSNASGLFGGVEPIYWMPPHTGTEDNPIMLPVVCNGPAGARALLKMRRLWANEAGGQ